MYYYFLFLKQRFFDSGDKTYQKINLFCSIFVLFGLWTSFLRDVGFL